MKLHAAQGENHCLESSVLAFQMGLGYRLTVQGDKGQGSLAENPGMQALIQGFFWKLLISAQGTMVEVLGDPQPAWRRSG